jgi:hypothetical protein
MLENLEHSIWLTFKRICYALNPSSKNLMARIKIIHKSWTMALHLTFKIPAFSFMARIKNIHHIGTLSQKG